MFEDLRPTVSVEGGGVEPMSVTPLIQMLMLSAAAMILLLAHVQATAVASAQIFKSGMVAMIALFGIAWMADTFIANNEDAIVSALGSLAEKWPFMIAVAIFLVAALTTSQSAATRTMVPLGLTLGIPAGYMIAFWTAVAGVMFLPANGTQIAAAEADLTGTTTLGKRVVDHSFQFPLQIAWIVTVLAGMAIVFLFFGDVTPAAPSLRQGPDRVARSEPVGRGTLVPRPRREDQDGPRRASRGCAPRLRPRDSAQRRPASLTAVRVKWYRWMASTPTTRRTAAGARQIETKLVPPRSQTGLVERARLEKRLDALAGCAVIVIDVPSASGRPSWPRRGARGRTEAATAWVSIDAADNDVVRLWTHIATALDHVDPAIGGRALARLRAPEAPVGDAVDQLVNGLAVYGRQVDIVLDDVHVLTGAAAMRPLEQLIERLPPNARLLLLARSDPPIRLGASPCDPGPRRDPAARAGLHGGRGA